MKRCAIGVKKLILIKKSQKAYGMRMVSFLKKTHLGIAYGTQRKMSVPLIIFFFQVIVLARGSDALLSH